jgi:hypothetical protein
MKKLIALILATIFMLSVFTGCDGGNSVEREFYEIVVETQEMLDEVADDIYSYWYDCIYYDDYLDDIDYAIACPLNYNSSNIDKIEENNKTIKNLYSTVRDGKLKQ